MSRKIQLCLTACFVVVSMCNVSVRAADEETPKYKTKEVMKAAFKGPLIKKVGSGSATDEDKQKLYDMLVAMGKNKPPKGEADSWEKLNAALVKAGKAVLDGKADGAAMLKKAANCKACHSKHKP